MTHYPVESTCYTKTIKEWSLLTTMLTLWYLDNISAPKDLTVCHKSFALYYNTSSCRLSQGLHQILTLSSECHSIN